MEQNDKRKLKRTFGVKMAIVLVMSSVIGSGVFKKVAPMSDGLQSPILVIIAWALAGIIVLFGVWSAAELGSMFPDSGGPYAWLNKIYGKVVSFLYGWASFTVIQTAAIAAVAYVFAGALDTFIPLPRLSPELESISFLGLHLLSNIGAKIVTCLLIIGLTIVNIVGTKKGGLISMIFTFCIVICLCFIIFSTFFSGAGSWTTFSSNGMNYPEGGYTFFAFISVMVLAMRSAFWGFEGWITIGFIGEELKNPEKILPKALTIGVILISVFYIVVNTAYLYVLPVDEMSKGISDPNFIGAVAAVGKMFGEGGVYIVSGMILIATFGCVNTTILMSARVPYAMSREKLFFRKAKHVHKKHQTPHVAIIYQCVWACVLTISGSFTILSDLVVIAAFIFYGAIVLGVIILRRKRKDIKRPYRTIGYPYIPIIFTLFCLVLLIISIVESPYKAIIGLLLVFSGLPFYYYWNKKNKLKLKEHLDTSLKINSSLDEK